MSEIPPATPEDLALDLAAVLARARAALARPSHLLAIARLDVPALVRLAAHWQAEAQEADERADAATERCKYEALCACMYETPGGVCMVHSPAVKKRDKEISQLKAKLESIRRLHIGSNAPPPCDIYECNICGILLCPGGSETHLWHDGCGICSLCTWRGPDASTCPDAWTTERTGQKLCNRHAALVELAQEPLRNGES